MAKKILITGGLGFIGTHCIEHWSEKGWDVYVIDNLSSNAIDRNHPIAARTKNIQIGNIIDTPWTTTNKFDMILHLASPVGPVGVLKHSGVMARIILDDMYWAIEGAKQNKCPLVFVSTSEVYGYRDHKSYLKETDDKVLHGDFTVRNEYAAAKLLSEIVLTNHGKNDPEFQYQIIRPFNVTGAFQLPDGGFVLPRFVEQALANEPITVYFSGNQLRAFTWVKDIVDGIYLASEAPKALWNQEWNIGNEMNEQSIIYLANTVRAITGSQSSVVHVDPTKLHGPLFTEAPEKIPDSTKIKNLLGWKPTKYVDDVIVEVIDFYRNRK